RMRMAAISDHLERSERVLLDVMNASGARGAHIDVSDAQGWAADLIDDNRLYREAAARAGDTMIADVLDDLERNLLEIVHGPSTLPPLFDYVPMPAIPPMPPIDVEAAMDSAKFAMAQARFALAPFAKGGLDDREDQLYDRARDAIENGRYERALADLDRLISM